MEKNQELNRINLEICDYFEQFTTCKGEVNCFRADKGQLTKFYGSMKERFFQNKLKQNCRPSYLELKESRVKQKILNNIKNPLASTLPKHISQHNLIKTECSTPVTFESTPMFTGVQSTKKGGYVMNKEIKDMVTEDIQNMKKKEEDYCFEKKFPHKQKKKEDDFDINSSKTVNQIKFYNQLLAKYKSQHRNDTIKLVDQCYYPELKQNTILDHQFFKVLDLFKKLYMETKSQSVNEDLLNYVLKFQKYNKLTRKMKNNNHFIRRKSIKNVRKSTSVLDKPGSVLGSRQNKSRQSFCPQTFQTKNSIQSRFSCFKQDIVKERSHQKLFKTRIHSIKQKRTGNQGQKLKL